MSSDLPRIWCCMLQLCSHIYNADWRQELFLQKSAPDTQLSYLKSHMLHSRSASFNLRCETRTCAKTGEVFVLHYTWQTYTLISKSLYQSRPNVTRAQSIYTQANLQLILANLQSWNERCTIELGDANSRQGQEVTTAAVKCPIDLWCHSQCV